MRDFIEYKNEKIIPFIKLIDTNIMDKSYNFNILKFRSQVDEILFNENNNDNFIPCIWFCKTGNRNKRLELDFLDSLINDYCEQKIPIIFVYTKAIEKYLINAERNFIQKNRNELEFVNILSRRIELPNGTYIESYGLHELLKKTLDKCKKYQDGKIMKITKNIFEELNNNLNMEIVNLYDDMFQRTNFDLNNKRFNNHENYIKNIFEHIIFKFLV